MKAYFNIDGLFAALKTNNGNTVQFTLGTLEVGGSSVLTAAFSSEVVPSFVNAWTSNNYEFGDCTQTGSYPNVTAFNSCAIGGIPNSWNPFVNAFLVNYDTTVDGLARGAILDTISGNPYGIEGFGFGFDIVDVPINDIAGGGSSGASVPGAFYMDIDFSQDFLMVLEIQVKNSSGTTIYDKTHTYSHDAALCSFSYIVDDNLLVTSTDKTQLAFLSGGLPGWITTNCSATSDPNCDPIVTQSICTVLTPPTSPNILSNDLQECCYKFLVLANGSSNDWENDINSFLYKRQTSTDTITFTLEKNGGSSGGGSDIALTDNTYGIFYGFGSLTDYPDYKGFQIQWDKVLALEGEGNYRLKVDMAFLSGNLTEYSVSFTLRTYSSKKANGTIRIQSIMNGYLKHTDFDYTGLNWKDGVRVNGFFGNRQPNYEKENLIMVNRVSQEVRKELINEYVMRTAFIPDCLTEPIIEYHALGNYLYITDYNLNNHSLKFINKKVVFESSETIPYDDRTRLAPVIFKFRDYVQDYQKSNC